MSISVSLMIESTLMGPPEVGYSYTILWTAILTVGDCPSCFKNKKKQLKMRSIPRGFYSGLQMVSMHQMNIIVKRAYDSISSAPHSVRILEVNTPSDRTAPTGTPSIPMAKFAMSKEGKLPLLRETAEYLRSNPQLTHSALQKEPHSNTKGRTGKLLFCLHWCFKLHKYDDRKWALATPQWPY